MYPNSSRSYAQAAANKKPAPPAHVQSKYESQADDEPDTFIVWESEATSPLEGASVHGYTETVSSARHGRPSADIGARNTYSQTAAGKDSAQEGSTISNDPYYQQYIEAMRRDLDRGPERKAQPQGSVREMLYLKYYGSTDGDTGALSGVSPSDTDTVSRAKALVSGVHRVPDTEKNSGVTTYYQGTSNSVPRDVLDIQFGWDSEEDENNLAQCGMSQSTAETVAQLPYAHGIDIGAAQFGGNVEQDVNANQQGNPQYSIITSENEGCTCDTLMYSLQDWCFSVHGKGPMELTSTIPILLARLRKSLNISQTGVPVCSEHGFPDLSAQSQCDQCAEEFTYVNSLVAAAGHQTPLSRKEPVNQVPVDQVPTDKLMRKEITKANKTLVKMKEKIEAALRQIDEEDRQLDGTVRWMDAMKEETERALESHVKRLHNNIDHQHQVVLDNFAGAHDDHVKMVERDKQKVTGFAGNLTGLQRDIERKFTEIKTVGVSATQTLPQLRKKFFILMNKKSQAKVTRPRYSIEAKSVTDEEIASIVGGIKITENNTPETTPSQIPSSGIGGLPRPHSAQSPKTVPASSAGQADLTFSQPAASTENLDPYYPYMDGGASVASLGQKEKLSKFMASASSVASEASCASSTRSSVQNQQKTTKMKPDVRNVRPETQNVRPEVKNTKPEPQKVRPHVQTQKPAPSAQPARDAKIRVQSKPRTIIVKPNCSPNVLRLSGPEPAAIAPTDDGKVWMVYADRGPNLHLMDGSRNFLQNIRIGGKAVAVAILKSEQVLLACHTPNVHLRLVKNGAPQHVMDLPAIPVSVSLGKSGLLVGGYKTLCWVTLSGWKAQWVVPEKDSPLKKVCATAVSSLQGKELLCAADRVGEAVHFYLKNGASTFTLLRPYHGPPQSADGGTAGQFVPISVTAHPKGIVAILDAVSQSLHVLNVEQSQQAVSVIPGKSLYCNGIPSVIAFGRLHGSDEHLKLWSVAKTEGGEIFVCHTPLRFQ